MRKTDADPDAHLAALPGEAGDAIRDVDVVIREEMRGLPRVMWEGVFWGESE